jgi:transglutaminase-like putative cysteine protease
MQELDNRYPYDILTADERNVIDQLETAFQKSDDDEFLQDDPGFSFVEIITILQAQNDILFPYLPSGLAVDQADGKVIFTGMKEAKKRYLKNKELKSEARMFGRQLVRQGMTEKEAVIAINNYVCDYLSLEENAGSAVEDDSSQVNAIDDRIASCRGYANLFKDMCNSVGIDCRLDFGSISDDPQGHVWDYVKVDGFWYYCDSVWNDGGSDEYPYMFSADLWEGRIQKYPIWGLAEADVG